MARTKQLKPAALILVLVVLAISWWLDKQKAEETAPADEGRTAPAAPAPTTRAEDPPARSVPDSALAQAIRGKRSKVWVEGEGRIVHLLPDDRRPPRHQLCLVELSAPRHTIKISHNVDLAPKVPWKKGDTLTFRGRFEWNDKGGVVHWTHHDPRGRKPGGWLRHHGKVYK